MSLGSVFIHNENSSFTIGYHFHIALEYMWLYRVDVFYHERHKLSNTFKFHTLIQAEHETTQYDKPSSLLGHNQPDTIIEVEHMLAEILRILITLWYLGYIVQTHLSFSIV